MFKTPILEEQRNRYLFILIAFIFLINFYYYRFIFQQITPITLFSAYLVRGFFVSFITTVLAFAIAAINWKDEKVRWAAFCFLVPVGLFALHEFFIQCIANGYSIVEGIKGVVYSKIIVSVTSFFSLTFLLFIAKHNRLFRSLVYFLAGCATLTSIIHLNLQAFFAQDLLTAHDKFNDIVGNNQQSYEALFAVLVLMYGGKLKVWKVFFIFVNLLSIIMNSTRGALLIFGLIFIYHFVERFINEKNVRKFVTFGIVGCVTLATVLYFSNFANLRETMTAIDFNSPDLKMDKVFAWGGGNILSNSIRIRTLILSVFMFFNSFIYGSGSAAAFALKINGVGLHSFLVLFMLAYGTIGISIVTLSLGTFKKIFDLRFNPKTFVLCMGTLFLIGILDNQVKWFYPILFLMSFSDFKLKEESSVNDLASI